jgi:hypothetical protein
MIVVLQQMRNIAASVDLACAAERGWALLADVRRVPEWVPGVADAEVLESDAAGRAVLVRFVSMPAAGSLDYVLRYSYDEGARTLRWWTDDAPRSGAQRASARAERELAARDERALRSLEGEARISERPGGCRLDYVLTTWAARTLPAWAQASLADDTPERTARAFQRWVTSSAAGG